MLTRENATALGYLAGWKIFGRLPDGLVSPVFRVGADVASDSGRGMDMLRRNLTRVVGPENVTRELVRDAVRSYARYWKEAFQLPRLARDPELIALLHQSVRGAQHIDAARDEGRGVILTLPHSGNWDMAGLWASARYGGFTTVAERLKPEALFDAFVDFRHSLGFEVLPLTGGQQPPMRRLEEVLRLGGIVCLLGERDMSRRGVPVTFFGAETTFPAGPVRLAERTGADLLVAHSWFTGTTRKPGWGFSISGPVQEESLEKAAQKVASLFEENIAAHPTDWHMLQPLWPGDIEKRARRRA
ncbi:phosphatidylinositol mannoside acyltransferase [Corynebacterium mayonis]|uniref:phosphatidylinositol mannoside acyltransferase n=1 Tax=Corynebacterium mayonis TaxID=3062461 RepID=UPI0031406690